MNREPKLIGREGQSIIQVKDEKVMGQRKGASPLLPQGNDLDVQN